VRRLALTMAVLSACGPRVVSEGGILATVEYQRLDLAPACVRIAVVDLASVGSPTERFVRQDLAVTARARAGTVRVGITQVDELGETIEVRASLHRGTCDAGPVAVDKAQATFRRDMVDPVRLVLVEVPMDGGMAGGSAGGAGGGSAGGGAGGSSGGAAGGAAGGEAGGMSGGAAGGTSGGMSGGAAGGASGGMSGGAAGGASGGTAGGAAGGTAGGSDAGCPELPPVRFFTLGTTSTVWTDVITQSGAFITVGSDGGARRVFLDGGSQGLGGGCLRRDLMGVSVRPGDNVVFATDTAGALLRIDPTSCAVLNGLAPSTFSTSVLALDTDTFLTSYAGEANTPGNIRLVRLNADGGQPSTFQSGFGQAWEVSGPAPGSVFSAGWDQSPQQRAFIWRWDPSSTTWSTAYSTNTGTTPLFSIDVPTPTLGFAGGINRFLEWNGTTWTERLPPPFAIFGLKVLSASEVYAVGTDEMSRIAFSQWDGVTWTSLLANSPPGGSLARVDGFSRCSLLAVGNGGRAVTTAP
jgi:hypothetical protein